MYQLTPHFILEHLEHGVYSGNLPACCMFVDLSGFTPMTETLMKTGSQGAEVLSEILAVFFRPMILSVYHHGGFITGFAGDAFTAVFPEDASFGSDLKPDYRPVLYSALEIQRFFNCRGSRETPLGRFDIKVKMGLAFGKACWRITGPDHHKAYYFNGPAIDRCTEAERTAGMNEIVLHETLFKKLRTTRLTCRPIGARCYLLQEFGDTISIPEPVAVPELHPGTASLFYPLSLLNATQSGEFRDVTSVFISFDYLRSRSELDAFIHLVITLTERFDGHFNRVDFGDKGGTILILFGAPVLHENDPERAMRFILALQSEWSGHFSFRAGINTGRVYAGMVGIPSRCEYATLGRAVVLAARLMMRAEWGEILVPAVIATHPDFHFDYKGLFEYKGIDQPIGTFKLVSQIPEKDRSFSGNLVGRDRELEQLIHLMQPLADGIFGGVVYVDGAAGAGKTRLVSELRSRLENDPRFANLSWCYLPCEDVLRKSFNPILHFFRSYFNQSESGGSSDNKAAFLHRLNQLIGRTRHEDIRNELIRTRSILGGLLNLHWEHSLYEQLDAKSRFENTLFAVKNLIKAESLAGPVVIELEDAHWLDDDTRNWLEVLTRNVDEFPFMVIATCRYRDDGSPVSFGLKRIREHRIACDVLPEAASRVLVENLLVPNTDALPENTFDFVYRKTEGNPFFIEQMCRYFLENNLLDTGRNLLETGMEIPASITRVIIARIDRLTAEMKDVVKTASVLGREFLARILSRILGNLPVDTCLVEGVTKNIWINLTDIRYLFRHALIRDAVYEMQLKQHLRELHRKAAETIEELYSNDLESWYFDLANHYRNAGMELQMLEYLMKAGMYAQETYLNQKALDAFSELVDLLPDTDDRKRQVLIFRSDINKLIGRPSEAFRDLKYALQLACKQKDHRIEAAALSKTGGLHISQDRYDTALEYVQKASTLARQLSDPRSEAREINRQGKIYRIQGKFDQALEYHRKALDIYTTIAYLPGQADALQSIGDVLTCQADYQGALHLLQEALAIWEETGNLLSAANTLNSIGVVYCKRSMYNDALQQFEKTLDLYRKTGCMQGEANVIGNIGGIHHDQGRHSEAMERYRHVLNISRETGDRQGEAIALYNLGCVLHEQNHLEDAITMYRQALSIFDEIRDLSGKASSIHGIGAVYHDRNAFTDALEHYQNALDIRRQIGNRQEEALSLNNIGLLHYNRGRFHDARVQYELALQIFREIGNRYGEAGAMSNIALLDELQGDTDKALKQHERAYGIFREIGARLNEADSLHNIGSACLDKHLYSQARESFDQAAGIFEDIGIMHRAIFSRSMQARSCLFLGHPEIAFDLSIQCIRSLDTLDQQDTLRECKREQIYFTHYLLLMKNNRSEAVEWLNKAYQALLEEMEGITDSDARETILANPQNRALVESWKNIYPSSSA